MQPRKTRICRVCGCEYDYCTANIPEGKFRWQDVACSPEHADTYFQRVAESRGEEYVSIIDGKKVETKKAQATKKLDEGKKKWGSK